MFGICLDGLKDYGVKSLDVLKFSAKSDGSSDIPNICICIKSNKYILIPHSFFYDTVAK